jgi:hypothetical protein
VVFLAAFLFAPKHGLLAAPQESPDRRVEARP